MWWQVGTEENLTILWVHKVSKTERGKNVLSKYVYEKHKQTKSLRRVVKRIRLVNFAAFGYESV